MEEASFPDADRSRVARLYGDISNASATTLIERLLSLDGSAPEPILLYIFSNGGCAMGGLAIVDTIRHLRSPVYTVGLGIVASMAAIILSVGTKGHRYVLPHARVLIHQARGHTSGREAEIESGYHYYRGVTKDLESILCETTSQPLERLQIALASEKFLRAEDAVTFGLADAVLHKHET